jgi:uncharacterized protein (DUF952 family)
VSRIYKILAREIWEVALAEGVFKGAGVDLADDFIHFSTAAQAGETARRYFHGQADLVVVEVEADDLGETLKWEPSRGGDLFPHLYGPLACDLALTVREAPLGADGVPILGDLIP